VQVAESHILSRKKNLSGGRQVQCIGKKRGYRSQAQAAENFPAEMAGAVVPGRRVPVCSSPGSAEVMVVPGAIGSEESYPENCISQKEWRWCRQVAHMEKRMKTVVRQVGSR